MTSVTLSRPAAEDQMSRAKRKFSEAARAALKGDPNAPALAKAAYDEVKGARKDLSALDPSAASPSKPTSQEQPK